MHDLLIKNGTVFDGSGGKSQNVDILIRNGIISEIGHNLSPARQTIDAEGQIITPGFIDLHTHYDGQVSWDDALQPSVNHGVTTAVMGNCGVGFAPCRSDDRDKLIRLMEGVEDIPGTALHEGLDWQWESFPEYLDALDTKPRTIDAFFRAGKGRPGSMSLMERDFAPEDWKNIIRRTEVLNEDGLDISFQVAPRAIGAINGLNCTFHPIMAFPSYIAISHLSLAERVEKLSDPAFKAQILSETPVQLSGDDSPVPPLVDMMIATFPKLSEKIFPMNRHKGSVDYEPSSESSIAGLAHGAGVSVWDMAYDLLLEDDGHALFYFPVYNYTHMNYDNVLTMMRHPKALPGLSDGGAHVGTICDASFPTYLLAHWTRDRLKRGKPGITLARAGEAVVRDDEVTDARPGKLVRSRAA